MASHYHHHHHHHEIPAVSAATNCFCTPCCPPPPPQQQSIQSDTLLQALTSLVLQQQEHSHKPQSFNHHHKNQKFLKPQKAYLKTHQQFDNKDPNFIILSSLLQRIEALESSLVRFTSSSFHNHCSLREAAARIIQSHFRAFLVRRSRALSQLKQLALIKSSFNSLKMSVSKRTHFDFEAVSSKAMELLLELDSIQSGDPMIRDGKRSISRDLVSFLDFIDGFAVNRRVVSSYRAAKNVRFVSKGSNARVLRSKYGGFGEDRREAIEKLRDRVRNVSGFSRVVDDDEEIVELEGFHQVIGDDNEEQSPFVSVSGNGGRGSNVRSGILAKKHEGLGRVKKSVSFAENGKVYRIIDSHEPVLVRGSVVVDESDSSEDQAEEEKLSNEIGDHEDDDSKQSEDDEQAHLEDDGGSSATSDADRNPRVCLRGESRFDVGGDSQSQSVNRVYSAPVAVTMESRDDLVKKRKALKIHS